MKLPEGDPKYGPKYVTVVKQIQYKQSDLFNFY